MATIDPGDPPVHPGPRPEAPGPPAPGRHSTGAPVHPGESRDQASGAPPHPGEPRDLDRDVDPAHPYRARQLAPYRRDAGLHDSGLTGRGAGADTEPDRASMLNARIAIVATIVVGQLWGLMVALNAWLEHDNGQVAALVGFQLLSFAVAVAVWRAAPRDR
jgi:hypothetical protein